MHRESGGDVVGGAVLVRRAQVDMRRTVPGVEVEARKSAKE